MKKNAFLLIATAVLFACSNSENENTTTQPTEEIKVEEKKEVIKDYDYFIKRISEDADWMLQVEQQAVELGISTEESLSKNAKFMAKQNGYGDKEPTELEIQIEKIKANPEWLLGVEKQAQERGISLDSMLVRAARYTLESKKNI
ncbi:MAG: hypothetical protein H6587_07300 [Flavobacteriales bacterium]|nr:hypothetical protein [Flavobacteriales bacterium]MCB9364356.1 hypothetical protein [Flavobacteriales bacterium]